MCYQAARKLAVTEVDLERAEARLEAAEAWVRHEDVKRHRSPHPRLMMYPAVAWVDGWFMLPVVIREHC